MRILHRIFKEKYITQNEIELLKTLSNKGIISMVRIKGTIAVARSGVNKGKHSALFKLALSNSI